MAGPLAALAARGLVAAERRGADPVWRYGPATPEHHEILGRVLRCYRERPVSMIKLVYAQAADPLRAFADAFRLRKKGE
jgi:nitroreductase